LDILLFKAAIGEKRERTSAGYNPDNIVIIKKTTIRKIDNEAFDNKCNSILVSRREFNNGRVSNAIAIASKSDARQMTAVSIKNCNVS
jgi:hypothetical protein